jgi:hypothetical protein
LGYNGPVNAPRRTARREYFPRAPLFSRLPEAPPTRRNNNRTRAAPVVLHNHMANFNRMEAMNQSLYGSSNGGKGSSNGGIVFSNGLGSPIEGLSPTGVISPTATVSSNGRRGRTRRGRNNRSVNSSNGNNNLEGLRVLERQNGNAFFNNGAEPEIRAHPQTPFPLMNVGSSGGKTWASSSSGSGSNVSVL